MQGKDIGMGRSCQRKVCSLKLPLMQCKRQYGKTYGQGGTAAEEEWKCAEQRRSAGIDKWRMRRYRNPALLIPVNIPNLEAHVFSCASTCFESGDSHPSQRRGLSLIV